MNFSFSEKNILFFFFCKKSNCHRGNITIAVVLPVSGELFVLHFGDTALFDILHCGKLLLVTCQ